MRRSIWLWVLILAVGLMSWTKQAASQQPRKAGERMVKTVDGIEYAFRWCPPGTFMMGSPDEEEGRFDWEGPVHEVTLSKGFWMLETEVTQAMWQSVMKTTIYDQAQKMLEDDTEYDFGGAGRKTLRDLFGFSHDDAPQDITAGTGNSCPMYYVNWEECCEFCRQLGKKLDMDIQLPTEAQWEYACRAGSTTALYTGDIHILGEFNAPALDSIAWYGGNSSQGFNGKSRWDSSKWKETQYPGGPCGVHPVGEKKPNAWGLYDMIGNVWEWCQDWAGDYPSGRVTNPVGPESGSNRVYRGSSWSRDARYSRSAARYKDLADFRFRNLGFRPVASDK